MRGAERRGQRAGKVPGLGKGWGRSGPVTRGPESRQGGWGEEKVGDAATVHGGASPAERPDRQTDEDRMEQARETDQVSRGLALPGDVPLHPPRPQPPSSSNPAPLLPLKAPLCPLVPVLPSPAPGPSLPARPPGSLPPLPLCLTTNHWPQPPSALLATHSLTLPAHTRAPHRPAPSLPLSLHPSPRA